MNAQRRKHLAKVAALLSEARGLLEEISSAEREAYENLPPSIQDGARGERMDEVASSLEEAVGDIENLETVLEEAQG